MRKNVLFASFSIFFLFGAVFPAFADVTSKTYVDAVSDKKENVANKVDSLENVDNTKYPSALAVKTALDTKVDVSSGATQTLEGTYTVTGTLSVPTPALPE